MLLLNLIQVLARFCFKLFLWFISISIITFVTMDLLILIMDSLYPVHPNLLFVN